MRAAEANVHIGHPDHDGQQLELSGVSSSLPPSRIRDAAWFPVPPVSFGELGR